MKPLEALPPLLVNTKQAAQLCGVGLSLFYALYAVGKTPESIKLNSKTLWSTEILRLWVKAGCPCRDSEKWQEILAKQ